jgi:molecular chaperone GrpE
MNTKMNDADDIQASDRAVDGDDTERAGDTPVAEADELMRAIEERESLRDRLLRTTAEFDNYRKRVERERREFVERAAEGVLLDVLPVVDDLERALAAETNGEGAEAYRRGVELIHKQLMDLLTRRGVKPIEVLGKEFDPHLHQAVSSEPAEGRADGEVIAELRRGYTLGDRLLRPAMVKVSQA